MALRGSIKGAPTELSRLGEGDRARLLIGEPNQAHDRRGTSASNSLGHLKDTQSGPCGHMTVTRDGKNWFVLLKGKRYGPYTFASLVLAAESGVVDPGAGVWCVGWAEWRIARNVPGLFNQEAGDSPEEEDQRRMSSPRGGRRTIAARTPSRRWRDASAASEPSGARNARIVILSVLSVLVIVVAAVWTAISLGFVRVTFLFWISDGPA